MKIFAFVLLSLFSSQSVWGQSFDFNDFTHPCKEARLETSVLRLLNKQKTAENFNQEKQQLSIRKAVDQGCRWTPTLSFERNDFDGIGSTEDRSTFFGARFGISYRKKQNQGDFYQLQVGSAYRVETQSGAHVYIPTGFGVWSHKTANSRWFYGGGVSDIFGKTTPFPILGVSRRWNEKWSTRLLFPLIVNTTYRLAPGESLSIIASPMSFQAQLANDGRFSSSKGILQARFRAYRVGVGLRKLLRRSFSLRLQAGFLLGRRYQIFDNNSKIYEEKADGAPFGEVGLRWMF
jgi:hypothetical protein